MNPIMQGIDRGAAIPDTSGMPILAIQREVLARDHISTSRTYLGIILIRDHLL